MTILFPPFEPDRWEYNPASAGVMTNVLPSADGWKPMPSLSEVSSALVAEPLGAIYARDESDSHITIVGTSANLYKLNTSTSPYGWTEVSKSTGAYSVPTGERWSYAIYGDYVVAANLGGIPQKIDVNSPTAFSDVTGAPTCRYIMPVGDYLVAMHLDGEPKQIQWSANNDLTGWTPGEKGSDVQFFPDGGDVMGGIPSGTGAIIALRHKFKAMTFSPGSGYTFKFSDADSARGVLAAYSLVDAGGGRFFYLSDDGFYQGIPGVPIGAERVNRWFFSQVDSSYLADVRGVVDPYENIVWWTFRDNTGNNVLLGYNWNLNRWCYSSQQIVDAVALLTAGVTWDGLDNLYATIDDVNVPFDSRLFKGGVPNFAGFTSDYKLAYFTGQNMAATLETATVELTPGRRTFVNEGRSYSDGIGFTAQIGTAERHGDTITWRTAVSPSSRSGVIPFRASGRLHRVRQIYAAGASWGSVNSIGLNGVDDGEL